MIRVAAVLIAIFPTLAEAQARCAPRADLAPRLEQRYGERRAAFRQVSPTVVEELWGNPATGSWTVLVTRAGGLSCIKSAGPTGFALPALRDASV